MPQHVTSPHPSLAPLSALSTLQITHNRLTDASSIRGILECPTLRVLDLANNRIDDPAIVDVRALESMNSINGYAGHGMAFVLEFI